MRLYRKSVVFVSYNRADDGVRKGICTLIEKEGLRAVYDTRLHAGDEIDPTLQRIIRESDALVAIGTERFMESRWCCREVSYAVEMRKIYFPLLFRNEKGTVPPVPDWFKGILPTISRQVHITELEGPGDSSHWLPQLRRRLDLRRPYKPISLVSFAAIIFILVPIIIAAGTRYSVLVGYRHLLAKQQQIEEFNRKIEEGLRVSRKDENGNVLYFAADDPGTGRGSVPIARDLFEDDLLVEREFLESGKVLAVDKFLRFRNIQGESYRKERSIFSEVFVPIVSIEDYFDARGRLACKIMHGRMGRRGQRIFSYSMVSQYPYWVLSYLYR